MRRTTGIISDGAVRIWRHWRLVLWLFLVNAILAGMGTVPVLLAIGPVLDHSLQSDRLVHGFDITAMFDLAQDPEVNLGSKSPESLLFAGIYFLFALFVNGGILETYRVDRKLTTGEFFQAGGAFFWRWVRMLVPLLIVLLPLLALAAGIRKWSGTLASDSPTEKLGFRVECAGLIFVLLLMMWVRLWFDMAQVRIVAEREASVLRALMGAGRSTLRRFGSLFWIYFRLSLLGWVGLAIGVFAWSRISAASPGLSCAVWEITLLWWMTTRLWQRASEIAWYQRAALPLPVVSSGDPPAAAPASAELPPV